MNIFGNVRFWLLREPSTVNGFFALLADHGRMRRTEPRMAARRETGKYTVAGIKRFISRLKPAIDRFNRPKLSFIELLAQNSRVKCFAPARWNALIIHLNHGGQPGLAGTNDDIPEGSDVPRKKAA